MKLIHVADLHASKERKSGAVKVLNTLIQKCLEDDIDLVVFAGDFWDCTVTNTAASGFSEIVDKTEELAKLTDVVMVYGTPEHEPDGSLEIFKKIGCTVVDEIKLVKNHCADILCVPEPRRARFLADTPSKSLEKIRAYTEKIGDYRKDKKPFIVAYHGEVVGARYQNGMEAKSPIAVSKELLQKTNADYYALGHIHIYHEEFPNAFYVGSSFPKDFGESHEGSYNLVEITDKGTTVKRVSFGFPVNLTLDLEEDVVPSLFNKDFTNTNLKIRFECKDSKLYKGLAQKLKKATNALSVKTHITQKQTTNVRAKEIIEQRTISDKFITYAKVNGIEYRQPLLDKIKALEESMLVQYVFPKHSFELLYARVRGANGFSHRDEVVVDFEKYNDGLIALLGENGRGKCVVGDTLVMNKEGLKQIGEYDYNTPDGFTEFKETLVLDKDSTVESSHYYKEQVTDTIRIKNSLGMELEGTYEHPVLTFNKNCEYEFKKLKDIEVGDYVCVPRGMNVFSEKHQPIDFVRPILRTTATDIPTPKFNSEDLSAIMGYYIANGSVYVGCVNFSSHNRDLLEDYSLRVERLFGAKRTSKWRTDAAVFSSRVLSEFITTLVDNVHSAREKFVPKCVLNGTKEEQRIFLRTLFDCDSSIVKSARRNRYSKAFHLEWCTASKQLATEVQLMLLNFGITSKIFDKFISEQNWTYKRLYVSTDVRTLMKEILYDSIKYKDLVIPDRKKANSGNDLIPFLNEWISNTLEVSLGGQYRDYDGKSYVNKFKGIGLFHRISPTGAKEYYDLVTNKGNLSQKENVILERIKTIIDKNYFYAEVRSKEFLKESKNVYDFTVPKEHAFFSNGFISHNTTLIENLHPYPSLLTRGGKLTDHFHLKDSCRELIYVDEEGTYYRILININGAIKSGTTEYLAYTSKDRENWVPVPDCNGNLKCYETWVNENFGSLNLFLSTSFTAKEETNCPNIATATASENMALFANLLGLSYYSTLGQMAKDKAKELEGEIKTQTALMHDKPMYQEKVNTLQMEVESAEADIGKYAETIEQKKEELKKLKKEYYDYIAHSAEYKHQKRDIATLEASIEQRQEVLEGLTEDYNTTVFVKEHEREISMFSDFQKQAEEQNLKIANAKDELSKMNKRKAEVTDDVMKLNKEDEAFTKEIDRLKGELEHVSLDISGKCPLCGSPLTEEKTRELEQKSKDIKAELAKVEKEREPYLANIISVEKVRDNLCDDISNKESEISELADLLKLTAKSLEQYQEYMPYVDAKTVNLDEYKKKIDRLKGEIDEDKKELEQKKSGYVPKSDPYNDVVKLEDYISETERKHTEAVTKKAAAESNIEFAMEQLKKISECEKTISALNENVSDYDTIAKALSTTGIQALEIEANVPHIESIANQILHEGYGDKFDISFETQRDDAKRAVFQVNVTNNETGMTYPMSLLSSGELIWVKQAIYNAFAVIRINSTGFSFKTRFMDETDGSLDSEMRGRYVQMINSTHSLGNTSKTVLVTHSQEIKDVITQVIEL